MFKKLQRGGDVNEGSDISIDVDGGVLIATFDRPRRLNAVREPTIREFLAMLGRAAVDDSVHAVVLTGRGRAFCAGQDLAELDESLGDAAERDGRVRLHLLQHVTRRMLDHPKILVAAINGIAVGFGAELSLACDVRIASTEARIGFVEVTRGLFETNGVMWLLPRMVGHGRAADLLLTGEIIDAEQAHRIGLVSRCVAPDQLAGSSRDLATRLAANAPIPMRLVKRVLRATWERDLATVMEAETEACLECLATEDVREGARAFLEKRPPVYQGR